MNKTKLSKFLSLVLRHKPEEIGIELDENGWAKVEDLLIGLNKRGFAVDLAILKDLVATNEKQRFCFSENGELLRANQGHSIKIDLGLVAQEPPAELYHGTVEKFIDSITLNGLQKQKRTHVHLSGDVETATVVAKRRGQPVLLYINALAMHKDGFEFYQSENGVWLVDSVPVKYIEVDDCVNEK